MKDPTYPVSLCEEINVEIISIVNDGNRGLTNFKWTLQETNATEKVDNLNNHLLDFSTKNHGFLKIESLFLQAKSNYIIQLEFENHF